MPREEGEALDEPLKRMKRDVDSSSAPLLETIETIEEEEEYVLLRFPCFDFFRNVHLCEGRTGESSSSGVFFNAEGVSFAEDFPPSRSVESPLLYLNAGTPTAMGFRGSWEELAEREGERTNRVILHLTRRAKGEGEAKKEEEGEGERKEKGGKQMEPPSAVSSLFCHLQEGVTADEKRQREEQRAKEAGDWVYDKVITPSAVLVMSRIS